MHTGQIPEKMSTVEDVANAMLSLIAISRANPTVVTETVHLAPRIVKGEPASPAADRGRTTNGLGLQRGL